MTLLGRTLKIRTTPREARTRIVRIAIAGVAALAGACLAVAAHAADPNLGRNIAANCATCHGTNGASAGAIPSLAGQSRPALVTALQEFRAGTRPATIMHQLAKGYSDEQIEALATFFAARQVK